MAMMTMSARRPEKRRSVFAVNRDNDDLDDFLKNALRMNDVEVSSSEDDQQRSFPRGKSSYPAAAARKKKLPSLRTVAPYPSSTTENNSLPDHDFPGKDRKRSEDIARRIRHDAANLECTPREHAIFMKAVMEEEEKRRITGTKRQCNRNAADTTRLQKQILKEKIQEEANRLYRYKPSTANSSYTFPKPRSRSSSCTSINMKKQGLKPPLTYVDLPNIRKDVNKMMKKRKVNKFQEDYGKTSDSLMKLKLHQTEHWSTKKRGKLKNVFRAYLATTPGSSYALDGLL